MSGKVNAYRTFELVVRHHVYIDFSRDGWPPVSVPSCEAPPQSEHPNRTLYVHLGDNGGSTTPSSDEMAARVRDMWGAKIVERGSGAVWIVESLGWSTKPYEGPWPPSDGHRSPPASDEFTLHVLPWAHDCDHVLHECQDGCGAMLVVWRNKAGVERFKREGFGTPLHSESRWHKTGEGYLSDSCKTGWRQVCDTRQRWQRSRGRPDEAERLAEYEQAQIQWEERTRSRPS